ncbi:MAG: hypothetical protein WCF77_03520 [Minisyncoccia bacterium]|jgi:hypothetical protein
MKSLLLVVIAAAAFLAGCGSNSKKTAPCGLSMVKVGSVALDGDANNFAKDALLHELFARGAKSASDGLALKGHVEYENGRLVALNFNADGSNIAAAASLIADVKKDKNYLEDKELSTFESATEEIAKKAAEQVCECVNHTAK